MSKMAKHFGFLDAISDFFSSIISAIVTFCLLVITIIVKLSLSIVVILLALFIAGSVFELYIPEGVGYTYFQKFLTIPFNQDDPIHLTSATLIAIFCTLFYLYFIYRLLKILFAFFKIKTYEINLSEFHFPLAFTLSGITGTIWFYIHDQPLNYWDFIVSYLYFHIIVSILLSAMAKWGGIITENGDTSWWRSIVLTIVSIILAAIIGLCVLDINIMVQNATHPSEFYQNIQGEYLIKVYIGIFIAAVCMACLYAVYIRYAATKQVDLREFSTHSNQCLNCDSPISRTLDIFNMVNIKDGDIL